MAEQWQQQRERGSPILVRFILWLTLKSGETLPRWLLYPITLYFYLAAPAARHASTQYLQRVLQRKPRRRDIFRHLHTFATTILHRVFFLSGQWQRFSVELHNTSILTGLVEEGRGALLLGAHHGSFDALRALGHHQAKLPVKVLMYPQHNAVITELLHQLDPHFADSVIPIGGFDTLLRVEQAVKDGAMVGILGDRIAESDKQFICRFFGELVSFPAGPAIMALTMQVPVVLVFGLFQGDHRYDIHCEIMPTLENVPRKERDAALQQWTQHYATRLEHYVRQAPFNWFNFYDFWQVQGHG